MNMQQAVQSRSSANGYGRRKVEKDSAARSDSKFHTGKANYSRTSSGNHSILLVSIRYISISKF